MAWTTYLSRHIFPFRPDWSEPVYTSLERDVGALRSVGGEAVWSNYDEPLFGVRAGLLAAGREEIADLRAFFDDKMGRCEPFWLPTGVGDLAVVSPVGAADSSIQIEHAEYGEYWGGNAATGRHLYFRLPGGSDAVRSVAAWSGSTLTLNEPLGEDAPASRLDSLAVSFLLLVRFAADELTIKYLTPQIAGAVAAFRALPHETPAALTVTLTTTTTTTTTTAGGCVNWGSDLTTTGQAIGDGSSIDHAFDDVTNDGNATGSWYAGDPSYTTTGAVGQDFGAGGEKTIQRYRMLSALDSDHAATPNSWTLEADQGDDNWVVLHTVTGKTMWTTETWYEWTFSNNTAYQRYRVNVSVNNGDSTYLVIGEIEMYECQD